MTITFKNKIRGGFKLEEVEDEAGFLKNLDVNFHFILLQYLLKMAIKFKAFQ